MVRSELRCIRVGQGEGARGRRMTRTRILTNGADDYIGTGTRLSRSPINDHESHEFEIQMIEKVRGGREGEVVVNE
jgi:hypothetical protein